MKVVPYPLTPGAQDALQSHLDMTSPLHRSTLKFLDDSLEEAYQKFIRDKTLTDTVHNPSVRERYLGFSAIYFTALLLMLSIHVIDSLVHTAGGKPLLVTQVVVTVGMMALGLLTITLTYFYSDRRKSASAVFILLYLFTSTGLSLTDKSVLAFYVNGSFEAQHLPALLPILLVTFAMESIIYYDFIVYCLSGVAIALIYLAVLLTGGQDSHVTVFESFFLLVFIAANTKRLYQTERMSRKLFYMQMAERELKLLPSFAEKSNQPPSPDPEGYNTELENIIRLINSSISILGEATKVIIYDDLRAKMKQALQYLHQAGNKLKAGPHILDAKLETMNPNIDEEDRIFVEENFLAQKPLFSQDYQGQRVVERRVVDLKLACDFEEVITVLNQMGKNWNFDTFFLQECTSGKALSITGRYFLETFNLIDKFHLREAVVVSYFEAMELSYKPNPYHNSGHAADVLNSCLYIAKASVLFSYMSDIEILGLVIAALGHDVGHEALTNRFLVNNRDKLAITYNDLSVLENMHSSLTFTLMQDEAKNILNPLDTENWTTARKVIVKMILATDMSRHFELLGHFKAAHNTPLSTALNKMDERLNLLEIIIKCGDIGHAAKCLDLHEKWTLLVCEEFFNQGDLEKALGQQVSMYCDRDTTDIAKSQSGFIANIVMPLFMSLNGYLDSVGVEAYCINQLRENKEHWDGKTVKKRRYTIKAKVTGEEVTNEFQSLKEKLRSWKRG